MPDADGSVHRETGRLQETRGGYALRRDGGGTWCLDLGWRASWRARRLVGRRAELTGVRDGFDLLAVERIGPE